MINMFVLLFKRKEVTSLDFLRHNARVQKGQCQELKNTDK